MIEVRKSEVLWTIPLLITLFFLSFPAYAKYSGGIGEPNDPYRIATAEDLMLLGESPEDYDKHFILIADIDLDPNLPGRKLFPVAVIAPDTDPITWEGHDLYNGIAFAGIFDGSGHMILHLTIEGASCLGLFGQLDSGSIVSNLRLEAIDVTGSGGYVGGLVGSNSGSVDNCYCTVLASGGGWYLGGLVGYNSGSIITSYSNSTIRGNRIVGGLVGSNAGSITTSYSTGAVSGEPGLGGLVGYNRGHISTSYSTGTVNGDDLVGGLVGDNRGGIITMSYSTGRVTADDDIAGGFVGWSGLDFSNDVIGCFWNIQTSGQDTGKGGIGKTTADMQTASTFLEAGWDFVDETENGTEDIWWILEGQGYPRLWWEALNDY